jgi:hypothetical protein
MSLSESSVHDRTTSWGSNVVYRHHHMTETRKQTSSCETRLETSSYNRTKLPMLSLQTENTHTHNDKPLKWVPPSHLSFLTRLLHALTHSASDKQKKWRKKLPENKTNSHSLARSCKIDFHSRSSGQSKPPPPPISSRLSHLQSPAIDASPKIETNSCSLLH